MRNTKQNIQRGIFEQLKEWFYLYNICWVSNKKGGRYKITEFLFERTRKIVASNLVYINKV